MVPQDSQSQLFVPEQISDAEMQGSVREMSIPFQVVQEASGAEGRLMTE